MQTESPAKTALVVLAHPDQRSFNGSWASATAASLEHLSYRVLQSDLTDMEFDAVESAKHYSGFPQDRPFDPLKTQAEYSSTETLPADIKTEIAKLQQADLVVIHFPLWWFAPPAILKGWLDRVLVHGGLHTVDRRFDRGLFNGKRVLFCVTTGASEHECAFNGKEGDVQMLLWPTAYTFRYLGFDILQPEIIHGVHGYFEGSEEAALQQRLKKILAQQETLLATIADRPTIRFNSDQEFDDTGSLRPDVPTHSYFIRHSP